MNDNCKPERHRAITAAQATAQPRGNIRTYRSCRWPQAERLAQDDGGRYMVHALVGWREFNAMPVMCVANDNFIDPDVAEAGEEQERRFDNLMTTQTARQTVALHKAGKAWRPSEERFDHPHQNDRARASTGPGQYKVNGIELYQLEADAEDEAIRAIDCTTARIRLGHVCCRLLDLASGDSTTEEISFAVKQPYDPCTPTWIDWAIVRWMRDDAYDQYVIAA